MFRILIGLIVIVSSTFAFAAGDPQQGKALSAVCVACHGQDGNSPAGAFPSLAGQGQRYLVKQLQDIKSGDRAAVLMTGILDAYSAQDMLDVAPIFLPRPPRVVPQTQRFWPRVKPFIEQASRVRTSLLVRPVIRQQGKVMRRRASHCLPDNGPTISKRNSKRSAVVYGIMMAMGR